jgi:hypothetical protein
MPVDQKTLDEAIAEASAGDTELAALLKERLGKNDAAAVAFTGGFTRTKDYTQKTQTAAEEKRLATEAKAKADQEVALYRQQLEEAETDKAKILRDLANQKITAAQANARLQHVKETYALSDDDIPPMGDLIDTRKSGKVHDSTPDMEDRLKAFKEEVRKEIMDGVTKQLIPELGGLASLPITWADMNSQHRELTGKSLTAKEQQDILQQAADQKKSLMSVWEEKYNIPETRLQKRDEATIAAARDKWEKEQAVKQSEAAMQGIRPTTPDQAGLRLSPVLQKEFHTREMPVAGADKKPLPSSTQRESLSGAERAAKTFLERRAAGIPMGQPVQKKTA